MVNRSIEYYREEDPAATTPFDLPDNFTPPYNALSVPLFDRPAGATYSRKVCHGYYGWSLSPNPATASWIVTTTPVVVWHNLTPLNAPVVAKPIYWASAAHGMTHSFFGQYVGIFGVPWGTTTYDASPVAELVPFSGLGPDSLSAADTAARVYVLDAVVSPGEISLYKVDETKTITPRAFAAPGATQAHHLALRDQDAVLTVWLQDGQIYSSVQAF